jgi:hypothetical protein
VDWSRWPSRSSAPHSRAKRPPPSSLEPSNSARQHLPLAISPDPIELGVLQPGQSARRSLTVRNTLSEPLPLERFETSCPCTRFRGIPIYMGPNETRELEVSFDPPEDPDFQGALCVNVTGYLADGRVALQTRVKLKVEVAPRSRRN